MSSVLQFPASRLKKVPRHTIIAVGSGKGGVGKTCLSITLADALAARGERVLLVDGDLGLANADIQLGITPEYDLGHVVAGKVILSEALIPIGGGAGGGGFDLIAGHSGSSTMADLSGDTVQQLAAGVTALGFDYDRVLIDLAAGVNSSVIRLAAAADAVLTVAINEPTSLTDAYAFIKLVRARRSDCAMAVIANRVTGKPDAARIHGALAQACRAWLQFEPPLAATIPNDVQIPAAIRAQTRLSVHAPTSKAALAMAELAAGIADGRAFEAAEAANLA